MNSLETIETVFKEKNLVKLNSKISNLGDLLKHSDLSNDEVIKSVNYLLAHIKYYEDENVIENILNVCLSIMDSHNIFVGFDLDAVVPYINELNTECISYILTFIGYSGKIEYKKILEAFLEKFELKDEAEEALLELNYRLDKMSN